jgi:hypothetical protein
MSIMNIIDGLYKKVEKIDADELRTSAEWNAEFESDIKIVDHDGWNRKDFKESWASEKITASEFLKRLLNSTVAFVERSDKSAEYDAIVAQINRERSLLRAAHNEITQAKSKLTTAETEKKRCMVAIAGEEKKLRRLTHLARGLCHEIFRDYSNWHCTERWCEKKRKPDSDYCGVHKNMHDRRKR